MPALERGSGDGARGYARCVLTDQRRADGLGREQDVALYDYRKRPCRIHALSPLLARMADVNHQRGSSEEACEQKASYAQPRRGSIFPSGFT